MFGKLMSKIIKLGISNLVLRNVFNFFTVTSIARKVPNAEWVFYERPLLQAGIDGP